MTIKFSFLIKLTSLLCSLAVIALAQTSVASQRATSRSISGRVYGLGTREGAIELKLDGLVASRLYAVLSASETVAHGLQSNAVFAVKTSNGISCFKQLAPANPTHLYHCALAVDRKGVQ